jgi:hypothetical protein
MKEKTIYNKPRLTVHGNIEKVTKGTLSHGAETGGYHKGIP